MFYLGGSRDEWRRLPRRRLLNHLADIGRLVGERDLRLTDISAYPHWSGPAGDTGRGDRARQEHHERLMAQALGPEHGIDEQGRRVLTRGIGQKLRAMLGGSE